MDKKTCVIWPIYKLYLAEKQRMLKMGVDADDDWKSRLNCDEDYE